MANTTKKMNVDFFQASKNLSDRTAEFFRCVIKRDEIKTVYGQKIQKIQDSLDSTVDMIENGTKIKGFTPEKLSEMKSGYEQRLAELRQEMDKLLSEQANFAYDDNDKKFKKSLRNAETETVVMGAIRGFFLTYGLKVADTSFEKRARDSIGQKINNKTLVKSEGRTALVFDVNNALKNLYAVSFEEMVKAGTIKPAQIPEVLRNKYTKKKEDKKK